MKNFLFFLLIALIAFSCNSKNHQKELDLSNKEILILKKENDILKNEIDRLKQELSKNDLNVYFMPKNYNPKILSLPDKNAIHPDWINSEMGTAWSLLAKSIIANEKGVFIKGTILSPNGTEQTNSPYFVILSEWDCIQ